MSAAKLSLQDVITQPNQEGRGAMKQRHKMKPVAAMLWILFPLADAVLSAFGYTPLHLPP